MSKFRIEGVGIDTTTLEYLPGEDFEFQYIFTSISSNNENIVRDFSKNAALVTYIDFLDKSDEAIISHLELLERDTIDLLLVDSKCDFIKYADTLSSCVDSGQVDTIGIMEPESVERIKEIQEVLPNLKYIGLFATGYNNIDIEYCRKNNITVCNAGSYSTSAVAQHTFALILEHYNKVSLYNKYVQNGLWKSSPTFSPFIYPLSELSGKTLGIVGLGAIGQAVARIANAFGMNVIAFNRSVKNIPDVQQVSFEGAPQGETAFVTELTDKVSLKKSLADLGEIRSVIRVTDY